MRPAMTAGILALAITLAAPNCEAQRAVPPEDVMLHAALEDYGLGGGLTPVELDGASGGTAMAMAADARVSGALDLQPGSYTLLLRTWAPAGDADGFFVEIAGQRTRRTAPIGRWGVLAYPFEVAQAGLVMVEVIGQEEGMTVDRIAVVRGTHADGSVDFALLPAPAQDRAVSPDRLPLTRMPVRLAHLPDAPFVSDETTVYHQSFEEMPEGASGEHSAGEGRWGQGLHMSMPDGRFDVDASALDLGAAGTVEWWLKPRPAARVWWDQAWRYFLHARPAQLGGFQIDLSRHPVTALRLSASQGLDPYGPIAGPDEKIELDTRHLDVEQWQHMLVSWDLTGERQRIWLLLNGEGWELSVPAGTFQHGPFHSIEFGNRPSDWDTPFLPMDGAIDEILVTRASVAERLAP